MKRTVKTIIVSIFIFSLLVTWFTWNSFLNQANSDKNEVVVYEVGPKSTLRHVARDLYAKGLIRNSSLFLIMAKIKRESNQLRVGEYALNLNMRPNEILSIITSGKSIERKITISEGLSIFEIADLMSQAGFGPSAEIMKLFRDRSMIKTLLNQDSESLEGYLFPETYKYTKFTEAKFLVIEMVRKFQAVYKEVEQKNKINGLSKHEIVTLASIIEKETGAPFERPKISSVFHNRIKKGMRLQTDPTIIYGKAIESGKIEIKISKADLSRPTAYNTYVINGLPPGPIANPGREALLAAVQPESTEFLFFVSHNDGTHEFTADYKSHVNAVGKFQLDKNAREGKSWRDLNKKDKDKTN